ncbi:hypothetical protein MNBD_GAMMA11-2870 [hydrothermal vent metagenome]|uniref:HTH cro/C1-type domain-containing protein n=1 Tax=hydrothermal vent metagenome TaxID=652676 RepID=A0A3B0XLK4_9ZZZZ
MTIHQSPENIFDDLGFTRAEADNLQVRSFLMRNISKWVKENNYTQQQAAEILNVQQSRVSDLMTGKINRFTTDNLFSLMTPIGIELVLNENVIKLSAAKAPTAEKPARLKRHVARKRVDVKRVANKA